ncbi:ATP-dependent DNA helicase [Methylobacterium iners]|uniref:ATP-dependent RecD-like DNA helicase n=1 Tax=Methylobacterium iners TaxID=418707 RepID=A0ABQ4S462_9HYPH|nr:AAA family ATPase [Methylobacterium iners]GJD97696.1 ATP-dependent RecD-like DNA helicase [Methylobacterium iners]
MSAPDLTYSPEQMAALEKVQAWLRTPGAPQVFRLFGYAGTGKTTLARAIAADLPRVVFAAFAGKAASVLRAKGCGDAMTLHSLLYRRVTDDLTRQPRFVLNEFSELGTSALAIIDECSMVDEKLGKDLLSFNRRILVLGDPAQLPPVKGGGFFTNAKPDVLLTEIHRQAAGNPIIALATHARQRRRLEPGRYGDSAVLSILELDVDTVLAADQVLCGRNDTRRRLNTRIRELQGQREPWPVVGDRLVCLANRASSGLLNGEIWLVEAVLPQEDPRVIRLAIRSEDGSVGGKEVSVHEALFSGEEHTLMDKERRGLHEFTFGYALTVHKAQGSQWNRVVLFDEADAFREDGSRFRYTGVTRAAETISVVLP